MARTDYIRSRRRYFAKRFSVAATDYDYDVDSNWHLFKSEHQGASSVFDPNWGSGDGTRYNVVIRPTTSAIWVKLNGVNEDPIYVEEDTDLEMFNSEVSNIYLTSAVGVTAQVQDVDTVADVSGSLGGTYFYLFEANSTTGEVTHGVWYDVDNGDTQPVDTLVDNWIEVDISADDTADAVATASRTAIGAESGFSTGGATNAVTITQAAGNACRNAADSTAAATGFTFDTPSTPGAGTATTVQVRVV